MNKPVKLKTFFSILVLVGCSNFLTDTRIDPKNPPIDIITIGATVNADVANGNVTARPTVEVSILWTEEVVDFTSDDIIVDNASITEFQGTGRDYSFILEIVEEGPVSFRIEEGTVTGISENTNKTVSFEFDHQPSALTLSISSSQGSLTNKSPIPITFTFSKDVIGFEESDITVTNGWISSLSGTGSVYTADLTFENDGVTTVEVPEGAVKDLAENFQDNFSSKFTITYDGTAPTVALSSSIPSEGTAGHGDLIFKVLFSEPVSGFEEGDFTITNATQSDFSGTGDTYWITLSPLVDGEVSISVDASVAQDDAGNGNIASEEFKFYYDSTKVVVNLTSTENDPTNTDALVLNIQFGKAVTGFTIDDLELTGATAHNFLGTDADYSVDIHPIADGLVSVTIPDSAATSADGNGFTNSLASFSFTSDRTAPTVELSPITSEGVSIEGVSIGHDQLDFEVLFSEPVTGFEEGDFSVTNASLTNFSGTDNTYWITLSPLADGEVNISVDASVAQDAAGNGNTASEEFKFYYDSTKVVVNLTSTENDPTNTDALVLNIHFEKDVTGFTIDDLELTGATAQNFSGTDADYSVDIHPIADGLVSVEILEGAATSADGYGFKNAASTFSFTSDRTAPTVELSSIINEGTITGAESLIFDVLFSEPVTGFEEGDFSVTNASLSGFSGADDAYSITLSPLADGEVSIGLASSVAQDAAGNGNTASDTFTFTYDGTPPTVELSSIINEGTITGAESLTFDVLFSEPVSSFDVGDFSVTNASLSDFSGADDAYLITLSPLVDGEVSISVDASVAQDAAGNGNTASDTFTFTYDGTPPTVELSSIINNGATTGYDTLNFDVLFSEPVSGFEEGDFTVTNASLTNFSGADDAYSITLSPLADGEVSIGLASSVAQDAAGNGNTASDTFTFTYRLGRVGVTIESSQGDPTNADMLVLTIQFEMPMINFAIDDLELTGATAQNFSGTGAGYTVEILPAADGLVSVVIPDSAATSADSNGLTNVASSFSFISDRTLPTVELSTKISTGRITGYEELVFNVVFSEPVENFEEGDITVSNATLSDFSGTGDTYSIKVSVITDGIVNIELASSVAQDFAGNGNTASETFTFTYDSTKVEVTFIPTKIDPTNDDMRVLTIQFEKEMSDFDVNDLVLTRATAENFSGTGTTYSVEIHPTEDGLVTLSFPDSAATSADNLGFTNVASSFSFISDRTAPTVDLSSLITTGDSTGFQSLIFNVVFSEPVEGLDVGDFIVSNATLSDFSGAGADYLITVSPVAEGEVSISVGSSVAQDSVGNDNTASDTFTYTYDLRKVGVNLTSTEGDPTNADMLVLNIQFDQEMTDFAIDDLVLTQATAQNFLGTGADYSVEILPVADGQVSVEIPEAAATSADGKGFTNASSVFSFISDRTAPITPVFQLKKNGVDTPVGSNTAHNDSLELSLITDYSGDGGSDLTFDYTQDAGATWQTFTNPTLFTAEQTYGGINIRVSDAAGNITMGSSLVNITIDTTPPLAPTLQILTIPVNAANVQAFNFEITAGGEAGAAFEWILSSDGGGTDLDGAGTIGVDGSATVSGLDVTSLGDGNLLLRARVIDTAGNIGPWENKDGTTKDTLVPNEINVNILSADPVNSIAADAFKFEFSNGEEGLPWTYQISSSGGELTLSDTGTFDDTGFVSLENIDVSVLEDGILTVSITQEDAVQNISPEGTDSIVLDAIAVNIVDFPALVDTSNQNAAPLLLTGEDGSTYSYDVSSSKGGTAIIGNGAYDTLGDASLSLDLNGLNDGYVVVVVDVLDAAGNSSREVFISEKNTAGPPSSGPADFSAETDSVTFDASSHGYQSVPSGYVRFDTTDIIGSPHADVFQFSALEANEVFTLDAGGGFDVIDLSNYLSTNAGVIEGVNATGGTAENTGTITIDLVGGETATIQYEGVERIEFSANNFSGSPHALELNSSSGTKWDFKNTTIEITNPNSTYKVGLLDFEGSLGLNYQLNTTFQPFADLSNRNGLIIFDYQDENNYKFVRAYAAANEWRIGKKDGGVTSENLVSLNETIDENAANPLQLRVTGDEGKTAELWSGGVMKISYTFDDALNDGRFGITSSKSHTEFTINMSPSNWAPYVKKYSEIFSQSGMDEFTLNIIDDAVDAEGDSLSIIGISTSSNGTLTDNGDGTVTYVPNDDIFLGLDDYTVTVSDGTNTTLGTVRFDVIP